MGNTTQLPAWVSYLQALAVPLIALVGAWIAARQMSIADQRLQYDVFDRRYERRVALYEATRTFLAKVFEERISDADIKTYGLSALDAQFLFDEGMYRYLQEIRQRVAAWHRATTSADQMPAGAERDAMERIERENGRWIIQQGDEKTGFATRFIPYLVQQPIKRAWWLRWP
jgi:hypothetical protein